MAEVPGKLYASKIPLKDGQKFYKGQLLVSIYNRDVVLALQARRSGFQNRLSQILPDIKMDYNERFEAWNDYFLNLDVESNLVGLPDYDGSDAFKTFLVARGVISEYYSIKSEEERLSKYWIYAPFTGSYLQVYQQSGSVANPGVKIADIIRDGSLELKVPLPSRYLNDLKRGQKIKIVSEDDQVERFGRIARISDVINPQTQSLDVFISVDGSSSKDLYNGQYVKAILPTKNFDNVVEVPRKVVYDENKVYIIEQGELVQKTIEVIFSNYKSYLIQGLEEGDTLLYESLTNARTGLKVKVLAE